MINKKVTREQLFHADEFSSSWMDHQQWRLDQLKRITSERTGIPESHLCLVYEDRLRKKLYSREGHTVVYRPQGIITSVFPPSCPSDSTIYEVSWVDPWGFPNRDMRSFLEIRFAYVDQITYQRKDRVIQKAWEKLINQQA